MQAIVQDEYGESEVLRLDTLPDPTPGDGEVLVAVHTAGVDKGAWHLMAGLPYPVRLVYGLRSPKDPVRGREGAGVVEAVGSGVTDFSPGDRVFGVLEGAFAEKAVGPAKKLLPMPDGLTFEQAAALPISGITAVQAVRQHGQVQAGQRVLVIGASGGVGSYAVQIAKAAGAEVTGMSSAGKADLVRGLGADDVLVYPDEEVTSGGRTYDLIIDIAGSRPLGLLRQALTPRGRLVLTGGEEGGNWLGGMDRLARGRLLSPFIGQTIASFIGSESAEHLREVLALVEAGSVVPSIDRTFPLAEAAAAIQYLQDGKARGKVVVSVGR